MAKDLDPKCKKCRREGVKLFLKGEKCYSPKCPMVKRNYPPGVHGAKGPKRLTEYGTQLREKQKAKRIYNLLEKQFRLTFDRASSLGGDVRENLLRLLEMRLDNVVYRLGLASSRSQARQLVNHGHFLVNNRKVNIPSFVVKTGDIVKIKKASRNKKSFRNIGEKIKKDKLPSWLNLDLEKLEAKVLHAPAKSDTEQNIDAQAIVEYYSR